MKKMRLLTFMQLAETNPEMSFETIQEELQISESEVESFIIDGTLILLLFCANAITPSVSAKQFPLFMWRLTLRRVNQMNQYWLSRKNVFY